MHSTDKHSFNYEIFKKIKEIFKKTDLLKIKNMHTNLGLKVIRNKYFLSKNEHTIIEVLK
jgi:hypothetical protein